MTKTVEEKPIVPKWLLTLGAMTIGMCISEGIRILEVCGSSFFQVLIHRLSKRLLVSLWLSTAAVLLIISSYSVYLLIEFLRSRAACRCKPQGLGQHKTFSLGI